MLWVEIESAMERACFGDGKRGRAIGTLKLERSTVYALQYEEVLGKQKTALLHVDEFYFALHPNAFIIQLFESS